MIETAICDSAKEDFLSGVHQPNDRYKIALYSEEAILGPSATEYIGINEVDGIAYAAGGKNLSAPIIGINEKDEAFMKFTSPIIWENADIRARGAMIYNASKQNKALAVFEFLDRNGKPVTASSTNGPFSVNIPNEGAIILS